MTLMLRGLALALALTIAGCGTNPGRCEIWTKGYPLCGL